MTTVRRRILKVTAFAMASLPLVMLAQGVFWGTLAADPYPPAIRETGLWSIRLLLLGLALSPLARGAGWGWPLELRRMVGLFAAVYALLHLLIWAKDYGFDWPFLVGEAVARTYLAVGLAGVALLVPLAATSTDGSMHWIGARAWRRLHWLVYPAVGLAYLHFVMAGRFTRAEVLLEGILLTLLAAWRLLRAGRRLARSRAQYH
jgi:methionine sulfoxide reductase heme-binding subunit